MRESELIREISVRAGVSRAAVRAVLSAFIDLVREGRDTDEPLVTDHREIAEMVERRAVTRHAAAARLHIARQSDSHAVEELIARARNHALGIEFLRDGYLASVAAEFGAHAFTVEAARQRLARERRQKTVEDTN